jgi:hypothetical protein
MTNDALGRTRHYPLPTGLDPRATTDEVLRRHGWSRPPAGASGRPHLADVLDRHFAFPVEAIHPEFVADETWGKTRLYRSQAGDKFANGDWAAVIRERFAIPGEDFTDPASWVSAMWVVPRLANTSAADRSGGTVGFWVGIDGEDHDQVLQAGIGATVSPRQILGEADPAPWIHEVEYWAWHEWFTSDVQQPSMRIGNFAVAAGDTVAVVVWAPQRDCSIFLMANVTKGHAFNVQLSSPGGIKIGGGSVEWAVEGITSELPKFDPITFTDCLGGSATESFDLVPRGRVTEIHGHDEVRLTTTTILSPTAMSVQWRDFD